MTAQTATVEPVPYELPSQHFRRRMYILGGLFFGVVAILAVMGVNPFMFLTEFEHIQNLWKDMFPPNLGQLVGSWTLYDSIGETISAAFLGTLFGGMLALFLSFFAATNIMPGVFIRNSIRTGFSIERAIPEFAVMLIIIAVVGVGTFTSTLALTMGSIGLCGKLFADAIEGIDPKPMEGLAVSGAGRWQAIRYCVIPQAAPSMLSTFFYAFDVNLRRAIILGYFGGGGLGFELEQSRGLMNYKDMLAYTLGIIVLVAVMERVSDYFRKRLLNADSKLK